MKYCTALFVCLSAVFFFASAAVTVQVPYQNVSVSAAAPAAAVTEAVFNASDLYGVAGEPNLPVYNCTVILPPDADLSTVTCTIEGYSEEALPGQYFVKPALPPETSIGICWPQGKTIVDGKDIGIYSYNGIFPRKSFRVIETGQLSCYKTADVRVYLFRYNPVTKTLYQMKSGKLVVDVKNAAMYKAPAAGVAKIPEYIRCKASKMAVNFNQYAAAYEAAYTVVPNVNTKMVVIIDSATRKASTQLNNFIASKLARGIDVSVISEKDWGGGTGATRATNIRTWLQNHYLTLPIRYVFLIGTPDIATGTVPMFNFPNYNAPWGSNSCPSDWGYAQLTGTDYKSDKKLEVEEGRLPIFTTGTTAIHILDSMLAKIVAYESADSAGAAWRKNALLAGPGWNTGAAMGCVYFNHADSTFIKTTPPWRCYKIYNNRYGVSVGQDTLASDISPKWRATHFGLVVYATHGAPDLAEYVLASSSVTATIKATQYNYPAFVFCISCSNASISSPTNLTYSLLKDCSVGAIGGTNTTYYGYTSYLNGSNNSWALNAVGRMVKDSMEIGDGLNALREMYPDDSMDIWLNRAPYALYGDPSLGINTYRKPAAIKTSSLALAGGNRLNVMTYNTTVKFQFKAAATRGASLTIYTMRGVRVAQIAVPSGAHEMKWNSAKFGAGIYTATISGVQATSARFVVK